jgi:DNA polymerase-3 subunit epsilon
VRTSRPLVAFDVETTGLVGGVDRIVELAAVAFTGDEVTESFAALVDPGIPMPPEVGLINGITDDMLGGKPRLEERLPEFLALLSTGTPVAHNAGFDVGFIAPAIAAAGLTPPPGPVLDTRGLARRAFPGRQSYSLTNLCRDLGLSTEGAHRALADAHACRLLFLLCAGRLFPAGLPTEDELVSASGAALDFSARAPRLPAFAAILEKARTDGAAVDIVYRSARGERSERRIEPLGFDTVGGAVAIVAFCQLRKERRTFLLNSIEEARLLS